MKAYNLADLERELRRQGWSVAADGYVVPQDVPEWCRPTGTPWSSPAGSEVTGDGATRADVFREAALAADLMEPDDPNLA